MLTYGVDVHVKRPLANPVRRCADYVVERLIYADSVVIWAQ